MTEPCSLWHHVPQDSLRPGSAVEKDPPWPSFDVVHRMDYERLQEALVLIAGITESPSDEIVRMQLHNAQRLAKEAVDRG